MTLRRCAAAALALAAALVLAAAAAPGRPPVRHYEYVLVDGTISVYDIDHRHHLVRTIPIPQAVGIRGVGASLSLGRLFISYGSYQTGGPGSLMALDLRTRTVLWTKSYGTGVDSFDLSRDGRTIYLPTGELSAGGTWLVVDAATGERRGTIEGGDGPHNTVVGLDGRYVYLGGRNSPYLDVASTASGKVVRQIGPLIGGVRPFTINGRQTLAFTTATGFLGFQLSSIASGRVLYTVPVPGFTYDPKTYSPTAPSHGISLSPDERELYVIDGPNSAVHVFDVSRGAAVRPPLVATIRLRHTLTGVESPCPFGCERDGWLQHSRDGRYVYVGDSGDVIDTRTRRIVRFLPALRNTRKMLEIDWRGDSPVATTTRTGLGYLR